MSKEDFYKRILYIIDVVFAIFGVASTVTGFWFFAQLSEFVTLRNINHYILDYRVYWPQVVPWLFIIIGVTIIIVAFCGWCGASREHSGLLGMYTIFLAIIILLQIIAAILIFVYVNGEYTDRFIKDTVYDGFYNSQTNPENFKAFGNIERKLRCCGANDARDYRGFRNDLPVSCCYDSYYRATCEFTDKEANERLGCAKVAAVYTKIISSSVAGISLLMVVIEIVALILSWRLYERYREVKHYIDEKRVRREAETDF